MKARGYSGDFFCSNCESKWSSDEHNHIFGYSRTYFLEQEKQSTGILSWLSNTRLWWHEWTLQKGKLQQRWNIKCEFCKTWFVYDVKVTMELGRDCQWLGNKLESITFLLATGPWKQKSCNCRHHHVWPFSATTREPQEHKKSLPTVTFPVGWNVTFTENYCTNELITLQYIDKVCCHM